MSLNKICFFLETLQRALLATSHSRSVPVPGRAGAASLALRALPTPAGASRGRAARPELCPLPRFFTKPGLPGKAQALCSRPALPGAAPRPSLQPGRGSLSPACPPPAQLSVTLPRAGEAGAAGPNLRHRAYQGNPTHRQNPGGFQHLQPPLQRAGAHRCPALVPAGNGTCVISFLLLPALGIAGSDCDCPKLRCPALSGPNRVTGTEASSPFIGGKLPGAQPPENGSSCPLHPSATGEHFWTGIQAQDGTRHLISETMLLPTCAAAKPAAVRPLEGEGDVVPAEMPMSRRHG